MLPVILFNVISSLVVDMAKQADFASDKVEEMIDDLIPESAKKELDKAIKDDSTHEFSNAKDALLAAAEGKLPIIKADGTLKPVEIQLTLKFDPTTGSVDIQKKNDVGVL